MSHYALILAAGKGSRLTNSKISKQFLTINNLPIVMHSIKAFNLCFPACKLYVGLPVDYDILLWKDLCEKYRFHIQHETYQGGNTRFLSVLAGLEIINDVINKKKQNNNHFISIHDSARPFIDNTFLNSLMTPFLEPNIKAVLPINNLKNSIIKKDNQSQYNSANRRDFLLCQTPQCFEFSYIYKAYQYYINYLKKDSSKLAKNVFHDDFSVFLKYYLSQQKKLSIDSMIHYVSGREYNIKITTDLDYAVSEEIYTFFKQKNDNQQTRY